MEIRMTSNSYAYANTYNKKRNAVSSEKEKADEAGIYLATDFKIDPDMPFLDLMKIVQEQEKNAPERLEVDPNNVIRMDVAEFGNFRRFTSTGNADTDYYIELGLKYTDSCFDLTHRGEFGRLTAEADYTGMSDTEKYLAIYEKYQYCYGENFLEDGAVDFPRPSYYEDPYRQLRSQFNKEIEEAIGPDGHIVRREALYGTADPKEVRRAIIDKYVSGDGSITFGNFHKMANEMRRCDVGEDICLFMHEAVNWTAANRNGCRNVWEYNDYLNGKTSSVGVNDVYTFRYSQLDKPVSSEFIEWMNYFAFTGSGHYGEVMSQILNSVNI